MKNLKDLLKAPLITLIIFQSLTSCFKDVDLEQIDEIKLQPTAVMDLVNFNLEADLLANDPGIPITITEEVSFEVVTNDLKESVVGLDLAFNYFNSLPRTFNVSIYFLTDRNVRMDTIEFEIPPGSKERPEIFDFLKNYQGEELNAINRATKIRVKFEMQPGPGATEGQLQLKSSAAYKFQF